MTKPRTKSLKGLRAGLLAGHTLVLQRVTGPWTVFVHAVLAVDESVDLRLCDP